MTQLNYSLEPAQVFVGTTTNLTLTMTNPIQGAPVVFAGGRDPSLIQVNFPIGAGASDLTETNAFTPDCNTSGFSVAKNGSSYNVTASSPQGATLNPGQSIVVSFIGVPVNAQTGQAQVVLHEFIGDTGAPAAVTVNKVAQELGVYAWVDPATVGESGTSTLWWQSTGGTTVTVSGSSTQPFPDQFPVQGDPPYTESFEIDAPVGLASQTTYTVRVFATGKAAPAAFATLTKHIPVITSFSIQGASRALGDKAAPKPSTWDAVSPTESVRLAWTTSYATGAYLSGPGGQQQWYVNPTQSQLLTRTPGLDLYNAAPDKTAIPSTARYTLTLSGFDPTGQGQGVAKTLTLAVQRVALAYLKYANNDGGALSGVVAATIPSNWPGMQLVTGDQQPWVLTIQQPGGSNDTYYLGTGDAVHPQIQYFNATPGQQQWTLDWVTANLASLTLQGVPQAAIGTGSAVVNTSGVYTLVGVGTNGQTVQSVLNVA